MSGRDSDRPVQRLFARMAATCSRRPHRSTTIGLLGALLLVGGIGAYLVGNTPAYRQDESSHVAYSIEVRQGRLPTVTTPVRADGDSAEMRAAIGRPYPFSDPEIHVANNPPFVYAAAVPATVVTRALDLPGGGLLGFRLTSLAGAMVGVVCSFLLGRELSGGDRFVGLVTAALVAGLISVIIVSSLANLDGPALGATTGVTWALARHVRSPSAATALHLGLWCAAAAAVRPMALAFAAAAGVVGLVGHARERGWRSLPGAALRIGGPTAVLTGWFYALNVHRYGDPTGSSALFEKYGTPSGPSIWSLLTGPEPFVQTLDYLVTDVYGRGPWWDETGPDKWAVTVAVVGSVVAAIALAVRAGRFDPEDDPGGDAPDATVRGAGETRALDLRSWVAVAVVGAVPMVLIAQHMSGGGAGHARYLMPVVPIAASAVALVTSRIHRWLSVGLVVVVVGVEMSRVRVAGHLAYRGDRLFGPLLNTPLLGAGVRSASVAVAVVGAVILVAVLGAEAWRDSRPPIDRTAADEVPC